ncbi:hypothetical protein MZP33_004509, partial [Escherichia coli]|nr:hypothetical protein [Escherichia coli]
MPIFLKPSLHLSLVESLPNTMMEKKYIELSISHPYILYMNIFTKSSIEEGYSKEISSLFMGRVQDYYKNINKAIKSCYNKETSYDIQVISLQMLEINIIQLCRELGIDYRYEKHEFILFDSIEEKPFTTSFSDEKQIKQMVTGLRELLVHVYMLIG